MANEHQEQSCRRWSSRTVVAFIVFVVVAAFYLWTDHRVHVLAAVPLLPYLVFLACPLMHLFMHLGHGGHQATSEATVQDNGAKGSAQ